MQLEQIFFAGCVRTFCFPEIGRPHVLHGSFPNARERHSQHASQLDGSSFQARQVRFGPFFLEVRPWVHTVFRSFPTSEDRHSAPVSLLTESSNSLLFPTVVSCLNHSGPMTVLCVHDPTVDKPFKSFYPIIEKEDFPASSSSKKGGFCALVAIVTRRRPF